MNIDYETISFRELLELRSKSDQEIKRRVNADKDRYLIKQGKE